MPYDTTEISYCDAGRNFAATPNMKLFISVVLWCILLVVCWPVALIMLFLFPLIWLIMLPFAIVGFTLEVAFKLITAVLLFPFRVLGVRV